MIVFTVECTNFHDAAEVETALKGKGIRYTTKVTTNGSGKKRTARRVTPEDVKDILAYLATHRNESNTAVGARFGVGSNTIWRIRNGTHALAKKVK